MARPIAPVLRLFLKDPWVRLTVLGALFGLGLLAVMVWSGLPHAETLPLHYNVYFGIDYLGSWGEVAVLPLAVLCLVVLNTAVGAFLWRRDRTVSYLLGLATVAVVLTLVMALAFIVYLNQ